jgi:anti-sigma regulatory factor (Ser/Thr protein kinase)
LTIIPSVVYDWHVPRKNVNPAERILALARKRGAITNRELVADLGITRQAVHRYLGELVEAGRLHPEGAGRSVRYVPSDRRWSRTYPLRGLAEDAVWREADASPAMEEVGVNARDIAAYALTEIVNNSIDHSGGKRVEVALGRRHGVLEIDITDDGVGAFEHLRRTLGLPSALDAIAEVSKGRVTTAPERHAGEGLFFVSKSADLFRLEANGHAWIVDNRRDDVAVGPSTRTKGTHTHVEISERTKKTMRELFDAFTDDFDFVKTRIVVSLFQHGVEFISRSEAKRLLSGLEKFRDVVLDFRGVRSIGQGFADEVFRVWASAHPTTVIRHENASEPVEFMIRRAMTQRTSPA